MASGRKMLAFWDPKSCNLDFWDFGSKFFTLNNIRSNSFFYKVGMINNSSRSGTCFSFCLTSSIYFSITQRYVFEWVNCCLCPGTHHFHSLKPISGPCSIEIMYPREWRIAIPASLVWGDERRNRFVYASHKKATHALFS